MHIRKQRYSELRLPRRYDERKATQDARESDKTRNRTERKRSETTGYLREWPSKGRKPRYLGRIRAVMHLNRARTGQLIPPRNRLGMALHGRSRHPLVKPTVRDRRPKCAPTICSGQRLPASTNAVCVLGHTTVSFYNVPNAILWLAHTVRREDRQILVSNSCSQVQSLHASHCTSESKTRLFLLTCIIALLIDCSSCSPPVHDELCIVFLQKLARLSDVA